MEIFFLKLTKFEFWPWKVFYFPLLPYYLYLAFKTKSISFPSIVNVSLKNGGLFEEDKKEILSQLPEEYLPKSVYVQKLESLEVVKENLRFKKIDFPFVAKPLNEQRGKNVKIIETEKELATYHKELQKEYTIQEFIDYPIELAVLYSRMPNENKGKVSSITVKDFLKVTGNGIDTIATLIKKQARAKMIWEDLQKNTKTNWETVLEKNEVRVIEKIGNHCRGTIFRGAKEIDYFLVAPVFDHVMKDFKGFYYGRFDMKIKRIEDLYEGKNIKILELNGVNADAAHIFEPNYPLIKAYKDVAWHWKRMSKIAILNKKKGFKGISLAELLKKI
jgi:hypothetical protein